MDLSKLSQNDKIVAGSGLVLFIASFLPWFGEGPYDGNGWDVGFLWGGLPALLGLAIAAVVVLRATGTELPDLPISWSQAILIGGAISAVLVILRLLMGYEACAFDVCVDISRKWGIFVAALASIGLVVGGFLRFQEEKSGSAGGPSL